MPFIVYQNPEDATRICMMSPTGEVSIEELIQKHVDSSKPFKVCEHEDISSLDGMFADAFQLDQNNITVNMKNATDVWRNLLRRERAPLMQQLDVQYMRALETNNSALASEIATRKQKLRDAPADARIEQASTTDELKLLTLAFLIS